LTPHYYLESIQSFYGNFNATYADNDYVCKKLATDAESLRTDIAFKLNILLLDLIPDHQGSLQSDFIATLWKNLLQVRR
jgi:hypothetical protein